MSLLSHKLFSPREKDERAVSFDARPPEVRAAEEAIAALDDPFEHLTPPLGDVRKLKARIIESEVMPPETVQRTEADNTRPPAYLGADHLDEIATLIRSLTYGEMMELAAALWQARRVDFLSPETLPGIWHRWADGRK